MSRWLIAKRLGVGLFFAGIAIWLLADVLVSDRAINQVFFLIGWITAIVGAVVNGVAIVKERFFSD